MFRLRSLHAPHDVHFVCDAGALRHERTEMQARNGRANAAERTAARTSRFRVPGLKLTWGSTKPEENALLLSLPGLRGKGDVFEQAREARDSGRDTTGEPFQKQAAMELVLVGAALTW